MVTTSYLYLFVNMEPLSRAISLNQIQYTCLFDTRVGWHDCIRCITSMNVGMITCMFPYTGIFTLYMLYWNQCNNDGLVLKLEWMFWCECFCDEIFCFVLIINMIIYMYYFLNASVSHMRTVYSGWICVSCASYCLCPMDVYILHLVGGIRIQGSCL